MLQSGKASWYGPGFHGRKTASGERFDMYELTAAHKTLPLGTRVKVLNPANGKEVVVRINDRGPYAHGRILDLSKAAASQLGLISRGHGEVVLQALGSDRLNGTGLSSTLASADVAPKSRVSPAREHQEQVLAQTRFGESSHTLGTPLPDELLPNWPVQDALTGLPVMAPPVGLAASMPDAARTGLSLPSWARADAQVPQRMSIPSMDGMDMAPTTTVARALDEAGTGTLAPASQPHAPTMAVAGLGNAAPATPDHRVIDEAKVLSVRHVPSAIAAGDLMLSGADPSLRQPMPVQARPTQDASMAVAGGREISRP